MKTKAGYGSIAQTKQMILNYRIVRVKKVLARVPNFPQDAYDEIIEILERKINKNQLGKFAYEDAIREQELKEGIISPPVEEDEEIDVVQLDRRNVDSAKETSAKETSVEDADPVEKVEETPAKDGVRTTCKAEDCKTCFKSSRALCREDILKGEVIIVDSNKNRIFDDI